MTFLKKTATLFLLFAIGLNANVQANVEKDITDKEIGQFVTAVQQVQLVEMNVQQQMIGEIEKENMEVDRFNEILQSQQNPEIDASPATEEETIIIQKIIQNLERIQMEAQGEMVGKIEDSGLSIERYQEIMSAVQTDPALQTRIQGAMQP